MELNKLKIAFAALVIFAIASAGLTYKYNYRFDTSVAQSVRATISGDEAQRAIDEIAGNFKVIHRDNRDDGKETYMYFDNNDDNRSKLNDLATRYNNEGKTEGDNTENTTPKVQIQIETITPVLNLSLNQVYSFVALVTLVAILGIVAFSYKLINLKSSIVLAIINLDILAIGTLVVIGLVGLITHFTPILASEFTFTAGAISLLVAVLMQLAINYKIINGEDKIVDEQLSQTLTSRLNSLMPALSKSAFSAIVAVLLFTIFPALRLEAIMVAMVFATTLIMNYIAYPVELSIFAQLTAKNNSPKDAKQR